MRFGQGCRSRGPRWAVPVLLLGCCVVLPGAALSLAQETKTLPQAGSQLATDAASNNGSAVESADYHSDTVKTQLDLTFLERIDLQVRRYPVAKILQLICDTEHVGKDDAAQLLLDTVAACTTAQSTPEDTGLAYMAEVEKTGEQIGLGGPDPRNRIVGDDLFVLASTGTHANVAQELSHIAKHGVSWLVLEVQVLEIPIDAAAKLSADWSPLGQPSSQVVQASFDGSAVPSFGVRKSILNSAAKETLLHSGDILSAPKIVVASGKSATFKVGSEHPFVTSVEIVKNEAGDSAAQPNITVFHYGITLDFVGTLLDDGTVQLQADYSQSELKDVEVITEQIDGQAVSVQKPLVTSSSMSFDESIPLGTSFAVLGTPQTRERTVQQGVPVLRNLPYINRLFKNSVVGKYQVSPVVLVRCTRLDRTPGQTPQSGLPAVTQPIPAPPVTNIQDEWKKQP